MLMLSRREGQRIRLLTVNGPIWITVAKLGRGQTVLGIEAPDTVPVAREELFEDEAAPGERAT